MHEIILPQMGQSVEEASIVMWLKKEGDTVAQGEPLFTIQTDKAEIECESSAAGVLRKILVDADVMVPVLTVVALVGGADEPLPDLARYGAGKASTATASVSPQSVSEQVSAAPAAISREPIARADSERLFVSPRARVAAENAGVDLSRVAGSGPMGRILEADVVAQGGQVPRTTPTARRLAEVKGVDLSGVEGSGERGKIMKADVLAAASGAASLPAAAPGTVKRIPLTNMRRIIAKRMSESKFTAPHYYVTVEVDMAAAKAFRAQTPFKPSFNDLVLAAVVRALGEFPAVNARWAGDAIEQVADINLGIAVALPTGLIVPVLRQAQLLKLESIAVQAKALAEKARTGKLLPDDYVGNTFTVSNLGPFGVDQFTAIINQPDSAILAVGQMKDRVVAIDGGIHIRPIMKLTMSSDHRVVDGAIAAQFMSRLKEILETAAF